MKSMACSIEGCEREIYCKTMCRPHYRRNKKYGDPLYVKADIEKPVAECSIPECGKPVRTYGWCYGHYMKNWRYGTPTPDHGPQWVDIRGRRYGAVVVLDREGQAWSCRCDCGKIVVKSAGDLNRAGDGSSCGDRTLHWRTDDCGYSGAHDRVRYDRGHAREYKCIDCGTQAQNWCYDHEDLNEMHEVHRGQALTYSLDSDHYDPRCISCHKKFDMSFCVRTHCNEGHEINGDNALMEKGGSSRCRICNKVRCREYRERKRIREVMFMSSRRAVSKL